MRLRFNLLSCIAMNLEVYGVRLASHKKKVTGQAFNLEQQDLGRTELAGLNYLRCNHVVLIYVLRRKMIEITANFS